MSVGRKPLLSQSHLLTPSGCSKTVQVLTSSLDLVILDHQSSALIHPPTTGQLQLPVRRELAPLSLRAEIETFISMTIGLLSF